jgi:hypothetical protein
MPYVLYLKYYSAKPYISTHTHTYILWHVDPLLGNDHEISSYTIAVAK